MIYDFFDEWDYTPKTQGKGHKPLPTKGKGEYAHLSKQKSGFFKKLSSAKSANKQAHKMACMYACPLC